MTLKDVQNVSLDILLDVDKFCKDHKIKYSLAGGTLLGAIRHKGFIPWDDDIDIMLPRPDYERLCKDYRSNNFKLVSSENDFSCMIGYARICDFRKTMVNHSSWTSQEVGIWIDVFPFDGAPDDFEKFKVYYSGFRKPWLSIFKNRAIQEGQLPGNTRKLNLIIDVVNCLHIKWINKFIGHIKTRALEKKALKIGFGDTDHVSQFVFPEPGPKEYYSLDSFRKYIDVCFEGHCFSSIAGYPEYLTGMYGDYMQLPPENQRVPKQDYLNFYWK